jgi:hypothetical protein
MEGSSSAIAGLIKGIDESSSNRTKNDEKTFLIFFFSPSGYNLFLKILS